MPEVFSYNKISGLFYFFLSIKEITVSLLFFPALMIK